MSRIIKREQAGPSQARAWQPQPINQVAGRAARKSALHPREGAAPEEAAREAQLLAEQRLAAAEAEANAIRRQAREAGLAEGRETAHQEWEAKQAELNKLVEEIDAERSSFFDRMEPEVARLAVTIAEKVLARELETRPEGVVDLVRSAMKRMREREALRIRLNPDDVALVRAAKDELMEEVNGVKKLDLLEDRRVGRGGCVIESSNGILDARIKTQLEELERVISEAATHGKPAGSE